MASPKYYYTFDSREDPLLSEVGGKGLSLIQSTRAGFDVPGGFVLSVAFFEPWLVHIHSTEEWLAFVDSVGERDGLGEGEDDKTSRKLCDDIKARCSELEFNTTQSQELDEALRSCFGRHKDTEESSEKVSTGNDAAPRSDAVTVVAVRSSSPEEDLTGTSFAGGYETTLGVAASSSDDLLEAVIASFKSMFDHRVVTYKLRHDMPTSAPRIAVVVQNQIASEVSGVAFSLNPQNNCFDEAVISAHFGSGERVVSGTVTPDTYIVDKLSNKVVSKKLAEPGEESGLVTSHDEGKCGEKDTDEHFAALSESQILRVSKLVSEVEEKMGRPADVEWTIEEDVLYLLQARPVTAYVPLFPEMLTDPGKQKNLYLDLIVQTQGFSDSMSVLGMDIWGKFLEVVKPHITHGEDGFMWEINGREYVHVSHFLGSLGGRSIITKMWTSFDAPMRRVLESIDLDEYVPSSVPPKSKRLVLRILKRMFQTVPSLVKGMWNYEKSSDHYLAHAEKFMEVCKFREKNGNGDEISFGKDIDELFGIFGGLVYKLGSIIMPYWSRYKLHKLFGENEEMKDLLVTLQMDLDGNPTSEMGHKMLNLASFPEVQKCDSGSEFVRSLNENRVSSEFRKAYDGYMDKFGCRGMKEIDIASPRTHDDVEHFFDRIKLIDINDNAIKTVKERKEEAYAQLLAKATEMGKEKKFKYHAGVIQKLGGYREHPKYLYVYMVSYLRQRVLQLGRQFAEEGRLDHPEQIFDLTIKQITSANSDVDLLKSANKNKAPYERVKHVQDWPKLIDSRGKIFRAPKKGKRWQT
uniref:Pyruvate phosphate dikinase AMP/ATP-binding domain-containing protein n=1 Tax=Odontella aurita TaxID=265563 RepID=A0A7S4MCW2_9STRA|mmetsp:Transcript_17880/g.51876  ORF Transcript_17880/g.51876 Transcript_17880/m.51876 type:complete len:803 (+) Transcript_17880:193-2601(+)